MRSTTSRGVAASNTLAESCEVSLDGRDPGDIDAPGLLYTDMIVEVPEDTFFAAQRHHRPRDDRPAKLLMHRLGGRRDVVGSAAVGVMV